jgi:hypothetical protein
MATDNRVQKSVDKRTHLSSTIYEHTLTGSRDVSDPRTDPGARVRGLRVGSLTSRLLFAPPDASAQTADAM